jgi:hypothetical protein
MTNDNGKPNNLKLSRRGFLGSAAIGAAAIGGTVVAASALGPRLSAAAPVVAGASGMRLSPAARASAAKRGGPIPVPTNWSQTADVVVVGYGGAGAVSAIEAYDAGANVIILEKTPSWASLGVASPAISGGGGSTCMSAGGSNFVSDPVAGANYIYQSSYGNTPMDLCQAIAWMESQIPAWFAKMGLPITTPATNAEFPQIPGGSSAFSSLSIGSGFQIFKEYDGLVQKRNIPVLFNTPATDLIQDPDTKEILGVQALANGSEVLNIKANRAVILATGSIEFDEALKSANYRCYPAHHYGWIFSTGDSVRMASKVGAAMWRMGEMSARMVPWFPDYAGAFGTCAPGQHGWIYVDKNGNRYADETQLSTYSHNWWIKLSDFDLTVPWYTRIPSFIVFDEACRKAAAITSGSSGNLPVYLDPRPKWSSDNSAEIARGWIQQGQDIPSLVAAINSKTYNGITPGTNNTSLAANGKLNISAATLSATINNYNAACAAKVDSQFGRAASTLVPIATPPFYAMPLWPGGPSAYGGPVRNARGQVCDADGNPIARLYANGENGSVSDGMLVRGANHAQYIAFGIITGNNAAQEDPWS